jgi:dephospho-CoA kinase
VIVSHAASYALADRDNVLRVLVTASPEARRRRLAETNSLDEKQATNRSARKTRADPTTSNGSTASPMSYRRTTTL